ncbi:MAG: YrzE family protein [Anaerobacillus sp.]
MTNFIGLFFFLLILIVTIFIYRRSSDFEPYLFLKLIGYTILGGLVVHVNEWRLPLGFLASLLFFNHVKVNAKAKRRAAFLGLIVFIVMTILPWAQTFVFEQPREVPVENTNFYDGSLVEEWENIHSKFSEESGAKVIDFKVEISKEGEMRDFRMSVEENAYPEKIHYTITLSDDDQTFIVKRKKVERDELQYATATVTEARFFLAQVDLITKPMIDLDGAESYILNASGQRSTFSVTDQNTFRIDTAGKEKVKNSELPAEAIFVELCDAKCDVSEHFLFDQSVVEPDITKENVLDVAQQDSPEIVKWLRYHIGDHIGYEKNGEFFLKHDGEEENVTEQQYERALKATPMKKIQENENMWEVTVENPYGEAPHLMEFKLNGDAREIEWVRFK